MNISCPQCPTQEFGFVNHLELMQSSQLPECALNIPLHSWDIEVTEKKYTSIKDLVHQREVYWISAVIPPGRLCFTVWFKMMNSNMEVYTYTMYLFCKDPESKSRDIIIPEYQVFKKSQWRSGIASLSGW